MSSVKKKLIERFHSDVVSSGSNNDKMIPPGTNTIPSGVTATIAAIGASGSPGSEAEYIFSVNDSDPADWQDLFRFVVDGNTAHIPVGRSWISQGNLQFRMRRRNNSGVNKRISCWAYGHRSDS